MNSTLKQQHVTWDIAFCLIRKEKAGVGGGGLIRVGVGVSKAVPEMGVWWDNGRREVSVRE